MNLYEYINFAFDNLPEDYDPRKGDTGYINMIKSSVAAYIGPCNVTKIIKGARGPDGVYCQVWVDRDNIDYLDCWIDPDNMEVSYSINYKKNMDFKPYESGDNIDPKSIISSYVSHTLSRQFGNVKVTNTQLSEPINDRIEYTCTVDVPCIDHVYGWFDTNTNKVGSCQFKWKDVPYE